ncbi:MAG TPA: aldo/keto reductase [Clostridiaceae bacterium]
MEYVRFGKTDRLVSRIGFGGAVAGLKNYLGSYDPKNEEDKSGVIKAILKAFELGINYFDTAPGYGNGESEKIFGEALSGVKPEDIFLASKVGEWDRDKVLYSVENSLKNLKRDYFDLLQIHGSSYTKEASYDILKEGGMLDIMEDLKRQGIVKFIGFTSEDNNEGVYDFIASGRFDTIQLCYNFIFQHPYEPSRPFGSLYKAEEKELGIAIMRSTTSGTFQKWIKLVNPTNTFDYTRALIQFVLSNPLVDVALIGMRTASMVEENVSILGDTAGRISLDYLHERYI